MLTAILIFLAGIMIIGISAAGRVKNSSDFYAAGKSCGVFRVTASLLSTILGSSAILGTISLSRTHGWASAWLMICGSIGLFCLVPLAGKIRRLGTFTLTDMLGAFYGPGIKRLACLLIPAAWTGVVAAQIIGSGKIIAWITPLSYGQGAILAGTAFTIYTLSGGQLSIIKTDIWQGLLMLLSLGIAVYAAASAHGLPSWEDTSRTFPFSAAFSPMDLAALLLTYAATFLVGPDIYSRLFCARDEQSAVSSVVLSGLCLIPAGFLLAFIGTTGSVHSFAFLTQNRLSLIIALGLLSAVISSADTTLLTAAAIFGELFTDLRLPSSIRLTRVLIGVFGTLSMAAALILPDIIQILLLAFSFFSGAFIIPTIAGILGFRAAPKRVCWAITSGGLLALSGKLAAIRYPSAGNSLILLAFLINAMILFTKKQAKT